MKRAPQGRYTREFRQEAVKLVLEENLSLPEAGRRLSLPPSTLGYWVKLYKAGKLGDVEMELARTKKELAEVKMERDILKKQPRTLPGSRCPVRDDEATAARLPHICPEPNVGRIGQWLLCLGGQAAEQASARGSAAGA